MKNTIKTILFTVIGLTALNLSAQGPATGNGKKSQDASTPGGTGGLDGQKKRVTENRKP